jgi:hypothetical protein
MPLHSVMVVADCACIVGLRQVYIRIARHEYDLVRVGIVGLMMITGRRRICWTEVRAVEREQPVDHESGERQYRQQPHPFGDRAG